MPGLISLVARNGELHIDVVGKPSFEDPSALQRDAIFRIASLSKPITAAVAMMLVDDGVFDLDDAVDHYLPELSDRRVLREVGAALDGTVRDKQCITTGLTGVLFTQRGTTSPQPPEVMTDFWRLAYEALSN